MNRISIIALVLLWIALLPAAAQDTSTGPLSLEDCLNIALENQVDIQIAENNVVAAKSRETVARSDYLPQVSVRNNAFTIGSNGVLTERRTGTAITGSQNIYDGGLREARVSGARHNVAAGEAGFVRIVQAVRFDVSRAYYQALRSKRLADVAEANVRYNESLLEMVQSRVEVGEAAQVDVLPVEAQLANVRVNLLAARNAVRVSSIQLQNAMGLSPQVGFDIQDLPEPARPDMQPVDVYVAQAVSARPDIAQAQAGVGAANSSVRSSRIAMYPRPQITGEYQKGLGGVSGESSQIFGGVVFDLFNGGANRAAHREAQAHLATAEQGQRQLLRDIDADVQQAYLNLTDASERLAASQVGFDAAQRNHEVQQARYMQGLAITLDLLNAEVQVVTAQTNLVEAQYDLYAAIAQMDFAVGKNGGFNANQDEI